MSGRLVLADGTVVSKAQLFQRHLVDAVQCLADIIASDTSKERDKIAAGKIIIEHSVGTPKQHVEVKSGDNSAANATVIQVALEQESLDNLRSILAAPIIDVEGEIVEDDDGE